MNDFNQLRFLRRQLASRHNGGAVNPYYARNPRGTRADPLQWSTHYWFSYRAVVAAEQSMLEGKWHPPTASFRMRFKRSTGGFYAPRLSLKKYIHYPSPYLWIEVFVPKVRKVQTRNLARFIPDFYECCPRNSSQDVLGPSLVSY